MEKYYNRISSDRLINLIVWKFFLFGGKTVPRHPEEKGFGDALYGMAKECYH